MKLAFVLSTSLLAIFATTASAQVPPPSAPPQQPQAAGALAWQHGWKEACARAAAEKKPLLIFVMKDREPACPRMLSDVYGDASVAAKLAGFVLVPCCIDAHVADDAPGGCPRFAGIRCSEHQAIEKELRPRFADAKSGEIIVPLDAICDSAGNVLLRHPWEMKRDAFLAFLENGSELFRQPAGAANGARSPMVAKLVDALLAAKSEEAREQSVKDLLSDATPEREAAFLDVIARTKAPADKGALIRAAGRPELKAFAPTIAKLLDEKDAFVRDCAVVTLEEQASGDVTATLLAAFAKEKDSEVRKDLLRALGPCGGGSADAKKLLLAELVGPKENLRAAAACSLGAFVKDDHDVATALEARFAKERGDAVRVALLWGIGQSEDPAQATLLDTLMRNQKDVDLQKLADLVRRRLEIGLSKMTYGHGPAHRAEIHRLLSPFVKDDKVVREYVRDLDRPNPKGA